jgi:gliding motility-associated-like protein
MGGSYQLRSVFTPAQFSFDLAQVSNKAITPNGDGKNDFVVFRLNNPQDSSVKGEIFDIRGRKVADMAVGTQIANSLVWDGKANGRVVPRGVYIYQIQAEGAAFNGTVIVIR